MKKVAKHDQSAERLNYLIAHYADGYLVRFCNALRVPNPQTAKGYTVPRGCGRRLLIDYRRARKPMPESLIHRIRQVWPEVREAYLRGGSPYATSRDAAERRITLHALRTRSRS